VRFTYDALGRRISKSDGTNETRFFWDGMRLLQEECKGLTSTYLYEQDSYVPLARLDQAEHEKEPRIYYFHCNASGQPEEMTDVDGRLVWRGRYSTWGKVVFETVTRHTPRAFSQNLRMQGQYDDRETGLCYNTFRYYDPDIGRFTSEDPIGLLGGINLYQYAPNPLAWIDPWGWNTTPYSEAPKVIGYENHHVIQDAAVKNLSGYNPDAAPTTPLKGPASMVGTQHHAATQVQRNTILGGTYGAERKVAFKALVAAEHTPREAVKIIHSADNYFNSIGVTKDTATRVPKNRPNPKRGAGCI
jgi:RHS repeat-associated protein